MAVAISIIIALLLVIIGLLGKIAYSDRFMKWRRKSVYERRGLLTVPWP